MRHLAALAATDRNQGAALAENALSLNKTFLLFGFAACAIIVAAVIATMPSSGRLEAHERTAHRRCTTEQVALDEGYGVSRIAERQICDAF